MKRFESFRDDELSVELHDARWSASFAIIYFALLKERAQYEGTADLEPMKTKIAEAYKAAKDASAKYHAIAAEKEGKTNE